MTLFQNLPFVVVAVLLGLLGAFVGSLINLGIYQLGFVQRPISPWSKAPGQLPARNWFDRIPILGWFRLKRESEAFGKNFWIRPMFIELACGLGLIGMYVWYGSGGLIGGNADVSSPTTETLQAWTSLWFIFHATLFTLLIIATFIDFDERIIPDWITIPGALLALTVAAIAPQTRLPTITTDLVGRQVEHLHYGSSNALPSWHQSEYGLLAGLAVILIWCLALLPTLCTIRKGPIKAVKFYLATLWPRARKTKCDFRVRERGVGAYQYMIVAIALLGSLAVALVWRMGGVSWDAMFSALMGAAFGGGLTWAVRIIASTSLGVEAMGFGDVTLMFMIGAFLGWQPSLLVFGFAPFASIVVVVIQLVTTGDQKIAFGPYLCIAAAVVTLAWFPIWNLWAEDGIFSLGSWLLAIIGGALLAGGIFLFVWGMIKARMYADEEF